MITERFKQAQKKFNLTDKQAEEVQALVKGASKLGSLLNIETAVQEVKAGRKADDILGIKQKELDKTIEEKKAARAEKNAASAARKAGKPKREFPDVLYSSGSNRLKKAPNTVDHRLPKYTVDGEEWNWKSGSQWFATLQPDNRIGVKTTLVPYKYFKTADAAGAYLFEQIKKRKENKARIAAKKATKSAPKKAKKK